MIKSMKLMLLLVLFAISAGMILADNAPVTADISINPNPMDKTTLISVTIYDKISANIVVETIDGVVLKTFSSGYMNAGTYEFNWNRLNDNGQYVPKGEYSVSVIYNTRYTSTKKTIILK